MPYMSFKTTEGKSVELCGNSEQQMLQAVEKNGKIDDPEKAAVWIKAFFTRRNCQTSKQKAMVAGDEAKVKLENERLRKLQQIEDDAKDYYQGIGDKPVLDEVQEEKKEKHPDPTPYPAVPVEKQPVEDDEDFM